MPTVIDHFKIFTNIFIGENLLNIFKKRLHLKVILNLRCFFNTTYARANLINIKIKPREFLLRILSALDDN